MPWRNVTTFTNFLGGVLRTESVLSGHVMPSSCCQGAEKAFNPFLRAADPDIRRVLGMQDATNDEVFAEIRRRKDNF